MDLYREKPRAAARGFLRVLRGPGTLFQCLLGQGLLSGLGAAVAAEGHAEGEGGAGLGIIHGQKLVIGRLARGEQAGDNLAVRVIDVAVRVDLGAAVGAGDIGGVHLHAHA